MNQALLSIFLGLPAGAAGALATHSVVTDPVQGDSTYVDARAGGAGLEACIDRSDALVRRMTP